MVKATKRPQVSKEQKKALADLMVGFRFGMSKDEVLAQLGKQIDERYVEQFKATTDVLAQDKLRKEKKAELARIGNSYIEFAGKKSGWDTSFIEDQFAHNTGESMLSYWENENGKNNRKFFFFADGRLYKVFVSLDLSIIPADKRNFDTFQQVMIGKYGDAELAAGKMLWRAGEFEVTAIDRLKGYNALCMVIAETSTERMLADKRKSMAAPAQGPSAVTKAVLDDGTEKLDVTSNSGAVDAVLQNK